MWALFYLSAGGYERTIKKMLKLMAGKMTSLAVSQLVSHCEMILSKQKNTGLKLWNDMVQTEKYRAILPLNPDLSGDDKNVPLLVMILQHFSYYLIQLMDQITSWKNRKSLPYPKLITLTKLISPPYSDSCPIFIWLISYLSLNEGWTF